MAALLFGRKAPTGDVHADSAVRHGGTAAAYSTTHINSVSTNGGVNTGFLLPTPPPNSCGNASRILLVKITGLTSLWRRVQKIIIIKRNVLSRSTLVDGFAQHDSHVRCCHLVRPDAIDIWRSSSGTWTCLLSAGMILSRGVWYNHVNFKAEEPAITFPGQRSAT